MDWLFLVIFIVVPAKDGREGTLYLILGINPTPLDFFKDSDIPRSYDAIEQSHLSAGRPTRVSLGCQCNPTDGGLQGEGDKS